MTVPTENRLSGPYNGNGVTTAFSFDFLVISDTHLRVVLTDADGVSADLVLVADYNVSGVGLTDGGSIEIAVPPATGETVTIIRSLPFTQETDLENQGAFQAQTIEDALDLAVMRDLVLLGRVEKSIHAPDTEDANMELPPVALRKNSYLLFDENGEPTYVNSQIDARYYGALAADPATRPDGAARVAGDVYFSTATLGFRVWSGSGWQAAIPPASLTLVNFTETAASAKTTFTISGGYTVGTTFAYLNGLLLAPDQVTMSNGTTAVLASACIIGDKFRLVGYSPFSVADTLSLSSNLNDVPDKPTALTNLGFSAYMQSLKATADLAALKVALALGLISAKDTIATADIAAASLATKAQAEAGSDNATLMTALRTAQAITALGGSMTLLGTLTTTSGASQSLTSLVLTTYTQLIFEFNGVSHGNGTATSLSIGAGGVITSVTAADLVYGTVGVSLWSGVATSILTRNSLPATSTGLLSQTGYSTATTTVSVATSGGSFDGGSVRVYGVR